MAKLKNTFRILGHEKDARLRNEVTERSKQRASLLTEAHLIESWKIPADVRATLAYHGITAADLDRYRLENAKARKEFSSKDGEGITAQAVIDRASRKPHKYVSEKELERKFESDIDKAKREITRAAPSVMRGNMVTFITNSGDGSNRGQHYVTVAFQEYDKAVALTKATGQVKKAANYLRKGKLKFHCTCDRWNYHFSYLATIGKFVAKNPQYGFPKIRNNKLRGVACKHVLRVMAEVQSSSAVGAFLEQHMRNAANKIETMKLTAKEVQEVANAKEQKLKTSAEREARRIKDRERAAVKRAVEKARGIKHGELQPMSPFQRRIAAMSIEKAAQQIAMLFRVSAEKVASALTKYRNRNK